MKQNDLSILCISCDKNEVIFKNFEVFFNKYWKSCSYDKYVLFENLKDIQTSFSIINNDGDFSSRILNSLNQINTPFVLVFLDDFFIESDVDQSYIEKCVDYMKENPQIANIGFSDFLVKSNENISNLGIYLRKHSGYSLMNYQVGIWKKDALCKLVRQGENPWYSEWYGTQRAIRTKNEFYGLSMNTKSPIDYSKGWVVVRGVWNLKEINRIRAKTNIDIDLGNLPIQDGCKNIPMSFFKKVETKIKIYFYKFKMLFRRKVIL